MTTRMYSAHRGSVVRPIAILLAVAGAGYVAGAFFDGTAPLRGGSAALVQSAQASEPRDPLSANGTVAPTDAIDWVQSDRERILQPCECDVAKGISTACVFMD
jgi:hypothetical protein